MKQLVLLSTVFFLTATLVAQTAPARPAPPMDVHLSNLLTQLERAALDANGALGRLRVDKWKTNSEQKQQADANVQSLQRNLSYAIPELTSKIRQAPQDLSANFKLYRNLNAVYDVLSNVAESAGAFGPKDQYEMLAQPVSSIDQVRHDLGDRLDQLTTNNQAELDRLRSQVQAIRQAEAAAPPKKIVVDDNAQESKTKKTKAKKPASKPAPKPAAANPQ
ncbi:MAG TPA: hypothetical protein VFU86_19075 [Terriglobales bacterium]|nr:hypothetical protein [Terriglobales bacterium]